MEIEVVEMEPWASGNDSSSHPTATTDFIKWMAISFQAEIRNF